MRAMIESFFMKEQSFLELLKGDPHFMAGVSSWQVLPEQEAQYADFPEGLSEILKEGLKKRGVRALYSHQAESFTQIQAGKDVLIVTPTASGKSLCYNLPVMQDILSNPAHRALYLFPTKALSQDQQAELNEISLGSDLGIKIATYDGDTPQSIRASARETGQIIISNPDMIHSGILPNHPKWIKYFRNLHWIVLDEVHTYRGVFGSHMANVLRRFLRVAAFYGAYPRIIACSATIANPLELLEHLCRRPFVLVDKSGAPKGKKHFILYNPPLVDPVQGIRRGTVNEARDLAVRALLAGIKTIVFARSRIRVELIAEYIRSQLAQRFTDNHGLRVESYRGGYLPEERRSIEKGLRDGSIQGVVSTNALELGIDIGGLDCAILAGYPGGIASVWQQAGRAGRSSRESCAILIASSAPLDQYLIEHEDYLSTARAEAAYINPANPWILAEHAKCAAFELPFTEADPWFEELEVHLRLLEEEGVLRKSGGRYYWANQSYPAEAVSLRSSSPQNVVIIDASQQKYTVLGEMDVPSAKEMLFPQAVYLHRGRQFLVQELDLAQHRCYVEEKALEYYTDAVVKRDIQVLDIDLEEDTLGLSLSLGDVLVRSQVSRFKKLRFRSHENIGYGDIALPEEEFHTRCLVLRFPESSPAGAALQTFEPEVQTQILIRLGQVLKEVAPAFLLCQSQDFGLAERVRDPHFAQPCLYIYDQAPGGSGLAEALGTSLKAVFNACLELLRRCPCAEGCPSCIGPRNPEEELGMNPKAATLDFLVQWLK